MTDSTAGVLARALPYIKQYAGKAVVVKYGGNAMINADIKKSVIEDIAFMKAVGIIPIVVHGGGPEITGLLKLLGKKSEFVSGLRVTDAETMQAAEMVLIGKTNSEIVALLNQAGCPAVGLSGKDAGLISAAKHFAVVHEHESSRLVDIGFVGDVEKINPSILRVLTGAGYTPVIAPIGLGPDGESYNINADYAAGEIAGALGAATLLLLTDVEGIYGDYHDKNTFIPVLTLSKAQAMIADGSIEGGMIPKVEACLKALAKGAGRTHIIDGREPHALLTALFSQEPIGTHVVGD